MYSVKIAEEKGRGGCCTVFVYFRDWVIKKTERMLRAGGGGDNGKGEKNNEWQ